MTDARATAKYVKGSPQKARLVIDLIRGRNVQEALAILQASRKRSARTIRKVLQSAIANATQQDPTADVDAFFVKEAYVNTGPTKHRFRLRPAPMGRAYRERRRQSHITIRISDEQ
ncbi:MAG: 50S ribosomal protein L22 [Acidobacteriota bacterium]